MKLSSKLRRLTALQSVHRHELLRAAAALALARLALWVLPFRAVRGLLSRMTCATVRRREMTETEAAACVSWAVGVASRVLPASTCLVQAMATKTLLARHGFDSILRLGVTRADAGDFRAHAWVESGGRVVVGGKESPSIYSMLPTVGSPRRCRAMQG
jgi:hypothetical protein